MEPQQFNRLSVELAIERVLAAGSIPELAMRYCALQNDTKRLFQLWDDIASSPFYHF